LTTTRQQKKDNVHGEKRDNEFAQQLLKGKFMSVTSLSCCMFNIISSQIVADNLSNLDLSSVLPASIHFDTSGCCLFLVLATGRGLFASCKRKTMSRHIVCRSSDQQAIQLGDKSRRSFPHRLRGSARL